MKNTIKFGIAIGIWLGIMIGVSLINNFVMLNLHDFMYYYTWEGMKTTLKIVGIEALILIPGSILYFRNLVTKELVQKVILEYYKDEEEP